MLSTTSISTLQVILSSPRPLPNRFSSALAATVVFASPGQVTLRIRGWELLEVMRHTPMAKSSFLRNKSSTVINRQIVGYTIFSSNATTRIPSAKPMKDAIPTWSGCGMSKLEMFNIRVSVGLTNTQTCSERIDTHGIRPRSCNKYLAAVVSNLL